MIPKQIKDAVKTLVEKQLGYLEYLYVRWQDEKGYEDWEDYIKAIKHRYPDNFVRATNSPFVIYLKYQEYSVKITIGNILSKWEIATIPA